MPIEGWGFILDLFIEREPNTFYRVVPSDSRDETILIILLTVIGLSLIIASATKQLKKIK